MKQDEWPPAHIVKAVAKAIRDTALQGGWTEVCARAAIKAYEDEIDKMVVDESDG